MHSTASIGPAGAESGSRARNRLRPAPCRRRRRCESGLPALQFPPVQRPDDQQRGQVACTQISRPTTYRIDGCQCTPKHNVVHIASVGGRVFRLSPNVIASVAWQSRRRSNGGSPDVSSTSSRLPRRCAPRNDRLKWVRVSRTTLFTGQRITRNRYLARVVAPAAGSPRRCSQIRMNQKTLKIVKMCTPVTSHNLRPTFRLHVAGSGLVCSGCG